MKKVPCGQCFYFSGDMCKFNPQAIEKTPGDWCGQGLSIQSVEEGERAFAEMNERAATFFPPVMPTLTDTLNTAGRELIAIIARAVGVKVQIEEE